MEFSLVILVLLATTCAAQTTLPGVTGCGADSYYDPFGVISSPNYPSNYDNMLDCDYNVYASAESSLAIIFNSFHVETVDVVTISCPTNASFPPQEYTGHTLPEPVSIPWCSQGLVNFQTDASAVSTGFSLEYFASVGGCGQTLYTGVNGFVNSPNWESPYGYNQNCFNIIWVLEQSTIHLHFRKFDVENCSSCNCDWLEIRCLDNSESGPVKYCGNHDNDMLYVYRCSQVLLWFHSDEANNYPGFHIEYNVYPDAGCGAPYYYPPSGVISSPNYPGEYYGNLDCNYDVQASPGSTISFIFKAFNTEGCCDPVNISCLTNSSFTPQIYSGQSLPAPVSVPWCSQGRVNFRSDYSIFDTGFTLDYFVSFGGCGNTLYTGSHGYVTSPSYPSYYGNDQNCTNIIWAEQPSHFLLKFLYIDVPLCGSCTCDWVEISCLDNNPSDKHRYCGDIESSLDFYQCTQVLVWFSSDSITIAQGFNLEYNITAENSTESTGEPDTTKLPQTTHPLPVTTFPPEMTTVPDTTKLPQTTHPLPVTTFPPEMTTVPDTTQLPQTTHPAPIRTIPKETTSVTTTTLTTANVESTAQEIAETTMAATTVNMETTAQETTIAVTTSVASTTKFQTTFPPAATTIEQGTTSVAGTTVFEQTTFTQAIITSEPACGETSYYGPTGVISSPNYPLPYSRNLDCNYYVYGSTGSSISFIFKSFDTEQYLDFVTISCPTNSSFPPKAFSGQSLPNPVSIPWCSLGLVNFRSDDSVVAFGFMLNYYVSEGGCGNTVYNESHGFVTTPNWPSEYGVDHSCLNIIWTPERSTIYIDFLEFFLHSCCSCDWLEISCLDNSEFGPYRYCGMYSYDSLSIYQCRQALLWFHSDGSLNAKGFNIEYNVYLNGESTGVSGTTTPTPPGSCGSDSYNGPSGTIISPNYPGNYFPSLKCQYYIMASTGSSIAIIFEHFDVQVDKDYLTISCETNTSFPEQRYSGNTLPPPISISWCSQGSLYFYTDAITEYSGFSLDYHVSEGGCGNTTFTGSFGYVTSPNYPSNYGDNHNCYNVISAPERSHFYLRYLVFNVQFSEPCSLDWVEVSCLDNNPSNKHRFCGTSHYPVDFYQCSEVLVWFHSDGATVFQGFNLEYNVYPDTGCGEVSYYGPSGNITSPSYPDFYNNSLYCDYDIYTSSPDGSIAIIFKAFNTEQCCDFVTVSCPTNSSYSPVTYSGHSIPPAVSVPWCSQGRVNFGSDISIVFPGFSLDYQISLGGCGNTVYTETNGYVSSPNYPSPYGNNQDCSNIIWAPKPTAFTINFLAMDTEGCCDFLELSCLDNPAYVKQRFDGNVIPPPQSIPLCTQILVRFVSDGSTALVGFNLEYLVSMDADILS